MSAVNNNPAEAALLLAQRTQLSQFAIKRQQRKHNAPNFVAAGSTLHGRTPSQRAKPFSANKCWHDPNSSVFQVHMKTTFPCKVANFCAKRTALKIQNAWALLLHFFRLTPHEILTKHSKHGFRARCLTNEFFGARTKGEYVRVVRLRRRAPL